MGKQSGKKQQQQSHPGKVKSRSANKQNKRSCQQTGGKKNGINCASQSISAFPAHLMQNGNKNKQLKQTLTISSLQTLYEDGVFYARKFLSSDECKSWIDYVEGVGFEYMSQKATRDYAHRECGRFQCTDWKMADALFERMKPLVAQLHSQVKLLFPEEHYPLACNGNIRLYKYDRGMSFGKHYDGSNLTIRGETSVTVLIYLSSCIGGATRFYPPRKKKTGLAFTPEAGAILMHLHGDLCLQHEADPVEEGIKYVLRTDLIFGQTS